MCVKSLVCAREAVKAPQLGETDGGAAKVEDRNGDSKRRDVKTILQSTELELSLSQQQSGAAWETGSLAGEGSRASAENTSVCLRFHKLNPNIWAAERGARCCRVPSPKGTTALPASLLPLPPAPLAATARPTFC